MLRYYDVTREGIDIEGQTDGGQVERTEGEVRMNVHEGQAVV